MARQLSGESSVDEATDSSPAIVTERTVQTTNGKATVQMEGFDMASLKKFKPVTFDAEGKMILPPAEIKIKNGKRGKGNDLSLVKNGEARYGFNAEQPFELLCFYMGLSGKKRAQVWRGKPRNKLHVDIRKRLIAQGIPMVTLGE